MLTPLDPKEPTLIGINSDQQELDMVSSMVRIMNQDLVDSGFDKYQYEVVKRGKNIYIERKQGG
jgi:hypothetical protein